MLLVARLIVVFLAWATWAVPVACYTSASADAADRTADPNDATASGRAVAAVG